MAQYTYLSPSGKGEGGSDRAAAAAERGGGGARAWPELPPVLQRPAQQRCVRDWFLRPLLDELGV